MKAVYSTHSTYVCTCMYDMYVAAIERSESRVRFLLRRSNPLSLSGEESGREVHLNVFIV